MSLEEDCMVHSNALIKKDYLISVRLPNKEFYDSRLHGPGGANFIGCTEDYDLWRRLGSVCVITHIPECLGIANQHGNNQSMKMNSNIFQQNVKILQENMPSPL